MNKLSISGVKTYKINDFYGHAEKTEGFHLGKIFERAMETEKISPEEIEKAKPGIVTVLNQIDN